MYFAILFACRSFAIFEGTKNKRVKTINVGFSYFIFSRFFKKKTIETKINESFCIIKCKRLKYFIIKKMAGLDVWHLELLRPGVQKSKDDFIMSTDFKL